MSASDDVKDIFLSHSGLDKERYVRPFAKELDRRGITYWLDEAEIRWGDRITAKINSGIHVSKYLIIFLSDNFLKSNWTDAELGAALNKENSDGMTVVLPLLIGEPGPIFSDTPSSGTKPTSDGEKASNLSPTAWRHCSHVKP